MIRDLYKIKLFEEKQENENYIDYCMWVTRDDQGVKLHLEEPNYSEHSEVWYSKRRNMKTLDPRWFPEVTKENSPMKVFFGTEYKIS